jgi:hypothetical protein
MKDDRLNPRDWGKGIPDYTGEDLMTEEEIHSFGVEIVAGQLQKDGYKIIHFNPILGSYPSIIAEDDKEALAIIVSCDIAPKKPKLKLTDKFGIIGYCNGYPTKPCFASISIGSSDPIRFEKSLALVGDGENLERCKSLSIELGIDKRVKFLGSCSNVNELLWQSLIGVQSSHWEGFGLTAVEMMAAGLPVIASNVEGLKQVVEGAGVLFKQNDEKELAQEINKLYENIEYRNLVIEKCINRSKDYSISKTVQEITDVYNNL